MPDMRARDRHTANSLRVTGEKQSAGLTGRYPRGVDAPTTTTGVISNACELFLATPRYSAKRTPPKRDTENSPSETDGRIGVRQANSETRRPGNIRRMAAFGADFDGWPESVGGDRTGWLRREDSKPRILLWRNAVLSCFEMAGVWMGLLACRHSMAGRPRSEP
jgi:hypothetical protein